MLKLLLLKRLGLASFATPRGLFLRTALPGHVAGLALLISGLTPAPVFAQADTEVPTVTEVRFGQPGGGRTFLTADDGDYVVTLTMSEDVTVTGTPTFTIQVGQYDRVLDYDSTNSTSSALQFRSEIRNDTYVDLDYDGLGYDRASALELGSDSISDASSNALVASGLPALSGVAPEVRHLVEVDVRLKGLNTNIVEGGMSRYNFVVVNSAITDNPESGISEDVNVLLTVTETGDLLAASNRGAQTVTIMATPPGSGALTEYTLNSDDDNLCEPDSTATIDLSTDSPDYTATTGTGSAKATMLSFTVTDGETGDCTPDAFSFNDQNDVEPGETLSNSITVAGLDAGLSAIIALSGEGQYAINDGARTQDAGAVANGDTVALAVTVACGETKTLRVDIGGVTDDWTVVARACSSDTSLSSLTYTGGAVTLMTSVYAYRVSVERSVTSVTIGATPTNSFATAEIAPNPLALTDGENRIDITVTAEDQTTMQSYQLTITRPPPSVTISTTTLTVNENGATRTYTVVMDGQPTGVVTVTPTSDATHNAGVAPTLLTFTATTWNTPQTVIVTGVNDNAINNPARTATISHTVSHTVSGYESVTAAPVMVTVADDDAAGVTVNPATVTVNEGATGSYTVVLNRQPTGTVTVTPSSNNEGNATVPPGVLTFTTANWDSPQTITVTGVGDDVDTADRTAIVSHTASGGGYTDVTVADVTVTVTDDDTADVTINPTSLSVAENGGADTYTVVLNTQPSASVTVTPASGDTTRATVSAALTFTTTNWDTAQTVTVTGVDDDLVNTSARTATITHTVTGASEYTGVTVGTVTVTVTNDDVDDVVTSVHNATEGQLLDAAITGLSALDRNIANLTTGAIAKRFQGTPTEGEGSGLTLAGRRVGMPSGAAALSSPQAGSAAVSGEPVASGLALHAVSLARATPALPAHSFNLALEGEGSPFEGANLWGAAGYADLEGNPHEGGRRPAHYDGEVTTLQVGVDRHFGDALLGFAVSWNEGRLDFTQGTFPGDAESIHGEVARTGVSFHPYLSWNIGPQRSAWLMGGYGFGDFELGVPTSAPDDGNALVFAESDVTQWVAAGGVESVLSRSRCNEFTARAAGLWSRSEVDATLFAGGTDPLPAFRVNVWQAQTELEATRDIARGGHMLRPYALVSARAMGGDGLEVGAAFDLGGGLKASFPEWGLHYDFGGRFQTFDTARVEEHLFYGALRYDAGGDQRGFTASVSQGLSQAPRSSWSTGRFENVQAQVSQARPGFEARFGYGWPARIGAHAGVLTAFTEIRSRAGDTGRSVGLSFEDGPFAVRLETRARSNGQQTALRFQASF